MLQTCIDMKLFLYGMIAAGIVGVWCLFWSNHFYNRAIWDMRHKDKLKGKWTGRLLSESKGMVLNNAEAFVRTRLAEGRQIGVRVTRLRQSANVAICAGLVLFALTGYAVFQYRYELYVLWQHAILAGAVTIGLLMLKFCMNATDKEELIVESWKDYLENQGSAAVVSVKSSDLAKVRAQPEAFPATEQERAQMKRKREKRTVQPNPKMEEQIDQIEKGIREAAASDSRFAGVLTPDEEKLFREVIKEYLS